MCRIPIPITKFSLCKRCYSLVMDRVSLIKGYYVILLYVSFSYIKILKVHQHVLKIGFTFRLSRRCASWSAWAKSCGDFVNHVSYRGNSIRNSYWSFNEFYSGISFDKTEMAGKKGNKKKSKKSKTRGKCKIVY